MNKARGVGIFGIIVSVVEILSSLSQVLVVYPKFSKLYRDLMQTDLTTTYVLGYLVLGIGILTALISLRLYTKDDSTDTKIELFVGFIAGGLILSVLILGFNLYSTIYSLYNISAYQ